MWAYGSRTAGIASRWGVQATGLIVPPVVKQLSDGAVLEKFKEFVGAQGRDVSFIDDPEKFPKAKYVRKLSAQKRGYIHTVNAGMVARGVRILAENSDDTLDYAVGVSDVMKVGMQIKQGEPLMMIHIGSKAPNHR
jgi:pyrimidine-nucleoside phosphorylase